ncbi:hypothetical protein GC163_22140 [bacterium]|nr:hypothetical protein [bacterium]
MISRKISSRTVWVTQFVFVGAFAAAYLLAHVETRSALRDEIGLLEAIEPLQVPRSTPLVIEPLYDDPELVSDEELAAVLWKVQPRFPQSHLKPNHVEHALRTWSVRATFHDPEVMSGRDMEEFLTDHGRFLASWGNETTPLLSEFDDGVSVRWGRLEGGSVHHDHWLASLTEAGVTIDEPVFTPNGRDHSIRDVLQRSLRDFRVDEVETEWSALAYGLWLPPQSSWTIRDGRTVSFDLLASRLMRGERSLGVCSGTHRVYSLMVLIRLDDEYQILSPAARASVWSYLEGVRDAIIASQFPDGHWPSNWPQGANALTNPAPDELFKQVIATGHHLEWLAIAPRELHPPHDQILKAADWVIRTTREQSQSDILARYTFFSHVGNALALWRHTHPVDFWTAWEANHPDYAPAEPVSALEALPVKRPETAAH